ncbi:MAG: phosphatase PAP2 family protein, partial [Solirubrobacterales bacterium]|nr:phosphatase PAP2 family protein [Solirubrobacterales bacterium]
GVAAGASAAVALALGQVVSRLVDRPRPFVAHPDQVHLFAPHAADASFPSDHATAAFAIATAILLRNRLAGILTMAAAAALAASRVVIGVHYPADVLAGAALGALVALVLHLAPLRRRLDAIADASGAALDRTLLRVRALRA